jgi:hypothetical protein
MTEDLSEKAVYLLDQVAQAVFHRYKLAQQYGYKLAQQYGPADRYGVVEWAANVPDLTPFQDLSDVSGVTLDVALGAWHPADLDDEFAATAQVTLGARSGRYFTRWHFTPVTLLNLENHADCERALSTAISEVYTSKRTLSAIQSVMSPEDAPSDMTVLPVPEGSVSSYSSPPGQDSNQPVTASSAMSSAKKQETGCLVFTVCSSFGGHHH